VPPLPPKAVRKTKTFIQQRVRGLHCFLEKVALQPFLREDPCVRAFTSAPEAEWETTKARMALQMNSDLRTDREVSEGETRWCGAIQGFTVPANAERVLMNLKVQLEPVDKLLGKVIEVAAKLAERAKDMSEEMTAVKDALEGWRALEEAQGDKAQVEHPNPDWANLGPMMGRSVALCDTWRSVLSFQPDINALVLAGNLRYQLAMLSSIRGLLARRAEAIKVFDAQRKTLQAHEAEQASAASKGKADQVARLDAGIQTDRKKMEESKSAAELMTKGLFCSELDRFAEDKATWLRETMGQMSASHFQYAKRLGIMWQGYITELGYQPQTCMDSAKLIFEAGESAKGYTG